MILDGVTQTQVMQQVQTVLLQIRRANEAAADLEAWMAGISLSDLVGIGFSEATAQAYLTAAADAGAGAQLYLTGLPPESYPQPPQAYIYAASQRIVIGPQ